MIPAHARLRVTNEAATEMKCIAQDSEGQKLYLLASKELCQKITPRAGIGALVSYIKKLISLSPFPVYPKNTPAGGIYFAAETVYLSAQKQEDGDPENGHLSLIG
jgi:hypothetical protein